MKPNSPAAVPMLPPRCGSWVGTSPAGRVVETFDRPTAETMAAHGWRVETALDYLGSLNRRIANHTASP